MAQTFFASLADAIIRFHRLILLGAALSLPISIIFITQLRVDSSLDSLMPSRDTQAQQLLADLQDAGHQDVLVVWVSPPESGDLEDGKLVIDDFIRNLSGFPGIGSLEARVTAQQERFFSMILLPHAGLYLSEEELADLLERLNDASIYRQIAENSRLLLMPMQLGAGELVLRDPLGLRHLWLSRWFAQRSFAGLQLEDGYLVDKERRHLLLFIRPEETAQNIEYTKRLMAAVSAAAETALRSWRQSHPAGAPAPTIAFAGGYPIALEDEAITRRDLQTSLIFSILGVSFLFLVVFRHLRTLFLMLTPLAMAVVWTFGALQLIFGHVNILTGAFAAVLLGLGIDFAIHLLNLYVTARQSQDQSPALRLALAKSGRAILMGGLTTAAAFFALGVSSFRGFQELGIITGIGIVACLTAMLVVLPALLVWRPAGGRSLGPTRPIPGFGLESLFDHVVARPYRVLGIALVLLVVLGISALGVSFEEELRALRPQQATHMVVERQLESILGGASGYLLLAMDNGSEEVLLNRARRVQNALDRLQAAGRLSHYRSILSYWPAPESQEQAMAFFHGHAAELDPDRIEATFRQALQQNGFHFLPEYTSYLSWLRTMVRPNAEVNRATFQQANLEHLLDPFLRSHGQNWKLLTYVYPREGLWSKNDLKRLTLELQEAAVESSLSGSEYRLAGWPVLTDRLKTLVWGDLGRSLILAAAAIGVALLLALRSPLYALLAAIPLLAGMVVMLGVMALASLPFNYANFIVLPLIVGIGIDDGIHIVHRWREESQHNLTAVLQQIGRAIVLTSLTTTIGFGSLACSHYPGLRSIGWVTAIGIISCLLASLILLPAIIALTEQRVAGSRGKRNS